MLALVLLACCSVLNLECKASFCEDERKEFQRVSQFTSDHILQKVQLFFRLQICAINNRVSSMTECLKHCNDLPTCVGWAQVKDDCYICDNETNAGRDVGHNIHNKFYLLKPFLLQLEDVDECMSYPCQNGGTCVDGANSYTCECHWEFSGQQCRINNCEMDLRENFNALANHSGLSLTGPRSSDPPHYWYFGDFLDTEAHACAHMCLQQRGCKAYVLTKSNFAGQPWARQCYGRSDEYNIMAASQNTISGVKSCIQA